MAFDLSSQTRSLPARTGSAIKGTYHTYPRTLYPSSSSNDTMYTKRDMKTPKGNTERYQTSAVVGLRSGSPFGGSPCMYTLTIVDRLMRQGFKPERLRVQLFADSNNNDREGRNKFLYR
ncbi:hypothetical protein EV426DRAFT_714835 [Tirmania nivea]|nr:hypothetical protein EV426DRAFT_714835 [Tirmania nivea]